MQEFERVSWCSDTKPPRLDALTETILLGNVAYRTGEKLEWDAKTLTATNTPNAAQYVSKEYREGWGVE